MTRLAMISLLVLLPALGARAQTHVGVQGHRGFMSDYPENTIASIVAAFEAGADIVEIDVAITADGQVVVIHDDTVDRTTDGRGPVHFMTVAELRELDAGSWFSAGFAGERVPTLEEALAAAEGRGRLNLEIKSRGRLWSHTMAVIEEAVRLVREADALDRVVFSSFELRTLVAVREAEPDAQVWLIDWDQPSPSFDNIDLLVSYGFDGWLTQPHLATRERVEKAKAAGLHVHVSRAEPALMHELISWGVDQFGADNVASLVRWLEENSYRDAD